jgi:hypothetical protein
MNAFALMSSVKSRQRNDHVLIILLEFSFSFLSPQGLGM